LARNRKRVGGTVNGSKRGTEPKYKEGNGTAQSLINTRKKA